MTETTEDEVERVPRPPCRAQSVVGENSAIRIGLAITLGGYLAMTSWWASGIQSRLDLLLSGQKAASEALGSLRSRVETLERSTELFTQVGSPALRPRIEALEKGFERINAAGTPHVVDIERRVNDLQRQLDIHLAEGLLLNKKQP